MDLHGQINAACQSRPGHPQPYHWWRHVMKDTMFYVSIPAMYRYYLLYEAYKSNTYM